MLSLKWGKTVTSNWDEYKKINHLLEILETTHLSFNRPLPGQHLLNQIFDGQNLNRNITHIDCDEVYPNLFIGNIGAAMNKKYLKLIGITHVVNTSEGILFSQVNTGAHFYSDVNIKYMGLTLMDTPSEKISIHFAETADFIDKAIESGGRVLVHCFMGLSRSATISIAYLMIKKGMTDVQALRTVRRHRGVRPNNGFLIQLNDLDLRIRTSGGYG